MQRVQQMASITDLQKDTAKVFAQLPDGPVILASRSKAAAVLVSIEEWNAISDELAKCRKGPAKK